MLTYADRPALYPGVPTFLGVDQARTPADLAGADVAIIGVPYLTHLFGFDADLTPRKIRQASAKYSGGYLPELDVDVLNTLRVVDYGDAPIDPGDLSASVAAVTTKVEEVLQAGALPITLGGSAPCSGYTCAAALSHFHQGQPMGAINLDAHGDNRESWEGDPSLSAVTWVRHQLQLPGFSPVHHMQIGMRGPGNPKANADWFKDQGCGLYTGWDIRRRGEAAITQEAIRRAAEGTIGLWMGVDWDVLDISVSPDWSYPEPLGLRAEEILHMAFEVGRHGCLGFTTMSSPAHSLSMHWMVIWTVLYLLAGVAVQQGKAEVSLD